MSSITGPDPIQDRARGEITGACLKVLRALRQGDGYPTVGSHDPEVIQEAMRLARVSGRTTSDYETPIPLRPRS